MTSFEMTIPDHVRENYTDARIAQGLTWEQMAEQFDRDAEPLPAEHAAPYLELAAWARAQGIAEATEDLDDDPDDHDPDDGDPDDEPADVDAAAADGDGADVAAAAEAAEAERGGETPAPEEPAAPTKPRKRAATPTTPTRSA
ncbi:hypothetical protein [Blastococcus sp. TF02A-26]|uniref:hypothetical protein n=1 Tax=Blastococcus sp. TF02A-26 TaxID=2250577 RepID=UPI000DE9B79E|nr:hypothetical protein [Blastococcus sp. TF02A-26]